MSSLRGEEIEHVVKLLKQKFISPYKIIYMIDQKEADYFKARNQSSGCCTATEITIAAKDQSKLQRQLASLISPAAITSLLPELMDYCADRYSNITEKAKDETLQITPEVQKYLIDSILAESVNKIIHSKLVCKISSEIKSLSTDIGLWATPATWQKRYPHIQLCLFEAHNLSELFKQGFTVLSNTFKNNEPSIFYELEFLEKDGKFEEILQKNNERGEEAEEAESNTWKVLRNPMHYVNTCQRDQRFRNLGEVCTMLQSIPFELNAKANIYLTVSDAIHVYHSRHSVKESVKVISCKHEVVVPINTDMEVRIGQRLVAIGRGSILIVSNPNQYQIRDPKGNNSRYYIKSQVSEAKRVNA